MQNFSLIKMRLKLSSAKMVAILSRGRGVEDTICENVGQNVENSVGWYLTHWPLRVVEIVSQVYFSNLCYELNPWALPIKLVIDECLRTTLVHVMAWCHQTTSHYLSWNWPGSMSSRPRRFQHFLPEANFGLWVLSSPASVCVCVRVCASTPSLSAW